MRSLNSLRKNMQGKTFVNLHIDFSQGGAEVLNRVIQAYGFSTKLALADHLEIASSSLANRYKRDFFPSDIVVRCMAETGYEAEVRALRALFYYYIMKMKRSTF